MLRKLAATLDTGRRPWPDPVAVAETAEYRDGQAEGASDSLADILAQISAPSDGQIGAGLRLGLPILVLLGALYLLEVWFRESSLLATVAWFLWRARELHRAQAGEREHQRGKAEDEERNEPRAAAARRSAGLVQRWQRRLAGLHHSIR